MATFIDKTYFINDINIPDGRFSEVQQLIDKFEPEILTKALGYELYTLVIAEVADPDAAPERIKDLIKGKEYTVSYNSRDQKVKWNGLINSELISLIAYYVYYQWQRANVTQTTTVSESKPVSENAERAVWANKAASAWRNCKYLYGSSGDDALVPSLYNFLLKYESDYEEWIFTELGSVNNLDL